MFDFLLRDSRMIARECERGCATWVHCAQGFNRGPSGVLAFLLLYTDATWEEACDVVKAARPRARTRHNTFASELMQLAASHEKIRRDYHTTIEIIDGGNDPADDSRR